MSKASKLFNASAVVDDIAARVDDASATRINAINEARSIREDRTLDGRAAFGNSYFQNVIADLKKVRSDLRSKLSSGSGETVGRFQVVDELLEKFDHDREKFFN